MTPFYTAADGALTIPLMTGISRELMKVNDHDDIARWWEVIDRTTGEPLDAAAWRYDAKKPRALSSTHLPPTAIYINGQLLAYLIWDPVHMYNSSSTTGRMSNIKIPFDVRHQDPRAYTSSRLREYLGKATAMSMSFGCDLLPPVHVRCLTVRAAGQSTTGTATSASVSPYILEQFEKEVGYKFRPEFIIDQGYYNNQYRVPSKEYKDFQAFQRREVAGLMKEMTDIVHAYGKEAMMFLGDLDRSK